MQCVDIFLENMHDFKAYEKAVEKHYKVYAKVFNFVRAKIHHDFNFLKALPDFISIFRYMKKNEDRFGMHIKNCRFNESSKSLRHTKRTKSIL